MCSFWFSSTSTLFFSPLSLCSSWETHLNASGQALLLNNRGNDRSSPRPTRSPYAAGCGRAREHLPLKRISQAERQPHTCTLTASSCWRYGQLLQCASFPPHWIHHWEPFSWLVITFVNVGFAEKQAQSFFFLPASSVRSYLIWSCHTWRGCNRILRWVSAYASRL